MDNRAKIIQAFEVWIDSTSKPAAKGAATKLLRKDPGETRRVFFSLSVTQEQQFLPALENALRV